MLTAKIEYKGLDAALERFGAALKTDLRAAVGTSLRAVADEAKANHKFQTRFGTLENSIREKVYRQNDERIGGTVEATAPHAPYIHFGTRAHRVTPKGKKALSWVAGGARGFSKGHMVSGIAEDPFLYRAIAKKSNDIEREISKTVDRIIHNAGL
jgi:hypothetical protein